MTLGRRWGLQVTLVRPQEMMTPHVEGGREQRPGAGVWSRGAGAGGRDGGEQVGSFPEENVLVASGGLLQHMNRYLGLGGLGGCICSKWLLSVKSRTHLMHFCLFPWQLITVTSARGSGR